MSSSPTPGIGGEAARSESKQGGPEGLRAFLHDAFRGGAELRQVRRSERPPPARVPTLGPRLYEHCSLCFGLPRAGSIPLLQFRAPRQRERQIRRSHNAFDSRRDGLDGRGER